MDRRANQAQIRRAYLQLLVTAHPDKGGAPERFQQLQAAYALLSDPTERLIYDEKMERLHGFSNSSSAGNATGSGGQGCSLQRTGGVTALVHGQTQGSRQQPPEAQQAMVPAGSSRELQEASAEIWSLQQAISSSGGTPDYSELAEAHLQRAVLYQAAGQLHHALFDAEEALALTPDNTQCGRKAAALVSALQQALQPEPGPTELAVEDSEHL